MANEPSPADIAKHLRKFTWGPVAFMEQAADAIDATCADNDRLRTYVEQLEAALKHATECCVAFQSGGQFNHLMRPGESVFNGVPRLVAKLSN